MLKLAVFFCLSFLWFLNLTHGQRFRRPPFRRFGPPPPFVRGIAGPGFEVFGGSPFPRPFVRGPPIGGAGTFFPPPNNAIFNPPGTIGQFPGGVSPPLSQLPLLNQVPVGTPSNGVFVNQEGGGLGLSNTVLPPTTFGNTGITTGIGGTNVPVSTVNLGASNTLGGIPSNTLAGVPAFGNTALGRLPGTLPNTAFPTTTGGAISGTSTFPGTIAGSNTLAATPFTTTGFNTNTNNNQFLLNNGGIPSLAQVNSLGTQVTSNALSGRNQDNMVLAAGNTFANRFTVTGAGAQGGATFQDPTSGAPIAGNTLVNPGIDNMIPGTGPTAVAGQDTTGLSPDVAVIGTVGTDPVDPNVAVNASDAKRCQETSCPAGEECVFAGEYPCPMYLPSLECRCHSGCRVMNFYIPYGQSKQVDSCGNVCSCDQQDKNRGTARCTMLSCQNQS